MPQALFDLLTTVAYLDQGVDTALIIELYGWLLVWPELIIFVPVDPQVEYRSDVQTKSANDYH